MLDNEAVSDDELVVEGDFDKLFDSEVVGVGIPVAVSETVSVLDSLFDSDGVAEADNDSLNVAV